MDKDRLITIANHCGIKGPLPARQGFRVSASLESLLRFAEIVAMHERSVCRDYCLMVAKDAPSADANDYAVACARQIETRGMLEMELRKLLGV